MLNFRELVTTLVPPWLRRGVGLRLMYVFALYFDALIELVTAAVKLRFPNVYSSESLPLLSRERRIRRGIGESNASFAYRLSHFFEAHLDRGGPYQMLEQIWHHYRFSPAGAFPVHLLYTSGARFDLAVDGTITRDFTALLPGLAQEEWARWWLVYEWPNVVATDGTWGSGGVWGDGGVWGSNLLGTEVTDLRLIPTEWNNGHCLGTLTLMGPGQALWGWPIETWGSGGTWAAGGALVSVEIE